MQTPQVTTPPAGGEPGAVTIAVVVAVALVALFVYFFWRKGRKLPGEHVFRAIRLSSGNRLFPTQVSITPQSVAKRAAGPRSVMGGCGSTPTGTVR